MQVQAPLSCVLLYPSKNVIFLKNMTCRDTSLLFGCTWKMFSPMQGILRARKKFLCSGPVRVKVFQVGWFESRSGTGAGMVLAIVTDC